jgi:hypothetical protein
LKYGVVSVKLPVGVIVHLSWSKYLERPTHAPSAVTIVAASVLRNALPQLLLQLTVNDGGVGVGVVEDSGLIAQPICLPRRPLPPAVLILMDAKAAVPAAHAEGGGDGEAVNVARPTGAKLPHRMTLPSCVNVA